MTTATPNPSQTDLFTRFTISELAAKTAYSESYLLELRSGWRPITASFKRRAALALNEPEATLFAVAEGSDG